MADDTKQRLTDGGNMALTDHLDDLRATLIRIAVVVMVAAVAFFVAMPWVFQPVILAPCRGDFPLYVLFDRLTGTDNSAFAMSLINTRLAAQLTTHLTLALQLGIIFTVPAILWFLWQFVSPGLYDNERRLGGRVFLALNLLFYLGMAVGYFLIFPLTLRFLADYHIADAIDNTITLDSYIDSFADTLLVMGLVFEMPVPLWIMGKLGIITRDFFTRWRRHAIVVLVIAAAVITPTSDPFTLTVVFLPLYLLWELSSRLVPKSNYRP